MRQYCFRELLLLKGIIWSSIDKCSSRGTSDNLSLMVSIKADFLLDRSLRWECYCQWIGYYASVFLSKPSESCQPLGLSWSVHSSTTLCSSFELSTFTCKSQQRFRSLVQRNLLTSFCRANKLLWSAISKTNDLGKRNVKYCNDVDSAEISFVSSLGPVNWTVCGCLVRFFFFQIVLLLVCTEQWSGAMPFAVQSSSLEHALDSLVLYFSFLTSGWTSE